MHIPGIDLDMNLFSSPVPPAGNEHEAGGGAQCEQAARSGTNRNERERDNDNSQVGHGGARGGEFRQPEVPSSPDRGPSNNGLEGSPPRPSPTLDVSSGFENSRPGKTTSHEHEEPIVNDIGEAKEKGTVVDCTITSDEMKESYDDMTRMVESWQEELYMMNVNNSILLDDMVKLGVDV
jgi:hypothetical protein